MQFSELGLSQAVLAALAAKGYSEATPIQGQAIPPLLGERQRAACFYSEFAEATA